MKAEEIKTLKHAQNFVEKTLNSRFYGYISAQEANDIMGDYTKRMLQMGAEMYKKAKQKCKYAESCGHEICNTDTCDEFEKAKWK